MGFEGEQFGSCAGAVLKSRQSCACMGPPPPSSPRPFLIPKHAMSHWKHTIPEYLATHSKSTKLNCFARACLVVLTQHHRCTHSQGAMLFRPIQGYRDLNLAFPETWLTCTPRFPLLCLFLPSTHVNIATARDQLYSI